MWIRIHPRKVLRVLVIMALSLALVSLAGQFSKYYLGHDNIFGLVSRFDVASEANVPTWFSSSLLLVCSLLLSIIAVGKKRERDRYALHWCALAVIFLFLSMDEAASFHELLNRPLQSALHTNGVFRYAWVIPYGVAVMVFALVYLKFFLALPKQTRLLVFVAGCTYVSGALGLELVGGEIETHWGNQNMMWALETTVEEFLEMLGVAVFIYALLVYLVPGSKAVVITIADHEVGEHISEISAQPVSEKTI